MKNKEKLNYIVKQIKDLFEVYIYINIKEDYKKGKDVANIFCEAIANESEDFIQGVMDSLVRNYRMKSNCYHCIKYDVCKFVCFAQALRFYDPKLVEKMGINCTHFRYEEKEK